MSRIDRDRTHRIAAALVAQVRAEHPEHENEVWGTLLTELMAGGLYGAPGAAAEFVAALSGLAEGLSRQCVAIGAGPLRRAPRGRRHAALTGAVPTSFGPAPPASRRRKGSVRAGPTVVPRAARGCDSDHTLQNFFSGERRSWNQQEPSTSSVRTGPLNHLNHRRHHGTRGPVSSAISRCRS